MLLNFRCHAAACIAHPDNCLPGLFVKGNIDPVNTLLFGSPETIEADARRRLAAGAARGGYILSTACSIAPHTPPEHVEMLAGLAEETAVRESEF